VNAVATRHMLFTGNPGTGKTTVARLVGRIFKALGLLKKGHFVEVTRDGLVGRYVGETAQKTKQVVESALDGVLFIDEAYALTRSDSQNDFGREAIDTLVPMMENHRDRLVVIVAGYSQEMQHFLDANSGIASRIQYPIEFPDYSGEDMHHIFLSLCQKNQYTCEQDALKHLHNYFSELYINRGRNFGNGRDVRNVYEKIISQQMERIVNDGLQGEAMVTITLEDLLAVTSK
jgi:SpoVK/Ycf46/Vps4 family AAA+-type ATPase